MVVTVVNEYQNGRARARLAFVICSMLFMGATDYDDILVAGSEPPLGQPSKEYNAQIDPIAARKLLTDCALSL